MSGRPKPAKPPRVPDRANRPARLALSVEEACAALGVSWDTWRQHVEPELRIVRVGRRKLVSIRELERWLDGRGERIEVSR